MICKFFFVEWYGDHRGLHRRRHSFPTRRSSDLDSAGASGKHYIFTGNPGTGKTTVARIMADVFKALGIVSRGQLIEADRSKLVAGFTGQTAIKTNQLIDSALGGVLFIDEAYTLSTGENDSFGKEALDTLLKRLEDDTFVRLILTLEAIILEFDWELVSQIGRAHV